MLKLILSQLLSDKANIKCNINIESNGKDVEVDINLKETVHEPDNEMKIEKTKILLTKEFLTRKKTSIEIKEFLAQISPLFLSFLLSGYLKKYPFLKKIKVVFCDDGNLILKGIIKKGIWWPFSVQVKLTAEENTLIFELLGLKVVEIIPLPNFIKETIFNKTKEKLKTYKEKYNYIELEEEKLKIHLDKALSGNINLNLKNIFISKEYLLING